MLVDANLLWYALLEDFPSTRPLASGLIRS